MSEFWTGNDQVGDLASAIEYFNSKLPGWWFSVGSCHVSSDASCAPDSAGCDARLIIGDEGQEVARYFDSGFDVDLPLPATMAEALIRVTDIALAARNAYFARGDLNDTRAKLQEKFGVIGD